MNSGTLLKFKIYLQKIINHILRKKVISFFVNERQKWNCDSIYRAFLGDSKYKVQIVLTPANECSDGAVKDMEKFFLDKGFKNIVIGFKDGRFINHDKIFSTDVSFFTQNWYFDFTPFGFGAMKKRSKVCYIPYSAGIFKPYSAGTNDRTFIYPELKKCDYIFTVNEYVNDFYQSHNDGVKCITSGMSKLDEYFKYRDIKKNGRKMIIYSPHWTTESSHGIYGVSSGFGAFDKEYRDFIKLIKDFKEIDFVFKPHPNLEYWMIAGTQKMTQEEWNNFIKEITSHKNCTVYNEGDYIELFAKSDGIINNSISFIAEYQPSNKPMFFLGKKEGRFDKLNDFGEACIDVCYRGETFEEARKFIKSVIIGGKDIKKAEREALIKNEKWFPNLRSSGKFIKDYIKKNI